MKFKTGDVVTARTKHGTVECVVSGCRIIQRGRHAGMSEYKLAPLEKNDKWLGFTVRGESLIEPSKEAVSRNDRNKAIDTRADGLNKREQRKADAQLRSAAILEDLGVMVGDEAKINYRNSSPRWERVVKVNSQTGKIAIHRPLPGGSLEQLMRDFDRMAGNKGRGPKPYRWIHAESILEVRCPEKACPCEIHERAEAAMAKDGHYQAQLGSEFIEQSYVISRNKRGATRGRTYDGGQIQVWYDSDKKVYWRDTGSFD